MKLSILIVLFLMTLQSPAQTGKPIALGIGFVIAENPYQFEDGSHCQYFFEDKGLTRKRTGGDVFPFFYKPDYGLYHFICIEKTDSYYKILINDHDTAYLANDESFHFKTWDTLLMDSFVERLSRDNPIKVDPSDASKTILNSCHADRLKVKDVIERNGQYWLHVLFSPECDDFSNAGSTSKNGWIQWRTKTALLVNILLLC